METLESHELRVQNFVSSQVPTKYATLLHTWEEDEVALQDVQKGNAKRMKGYQKLKNSCKRAHKDGYEWIWVDTCCIDKRSSAEPSEAINSMFRYYGHSAVCYVYMPDVEGKGGSFEQSSFGAKIGTKQSLSREISAAAKLPEDVVQGVKPVFACNTAQRMSWASQRETTREDDIASCLFELFDIHLPRLYGEGAEKAFLRLQEAILYQCSDHTLFILTKASSRRTWTRTTKPRPSTSS
ncbi:hypothetical protein EJ04DRAFT_535920 [Polyplosphaeria fusca]|uniref:Heterokaryon incompatibility domain-containing protein n=1 Tax=Polyplosphaeria fusca TaxID=682080 RepID=A0A9P4QU18_9PLEO|nr:hypothetical protein EJ04DRAFT_535920 [Polyplosphaeria fusca]